MYCIKSLISTIRYSRDKTVSIKRILNINFVQPLRQISEKVDDTDKMVHEICQGNPELENKLRILMLEVEVMRQDGRYAPDNMKKDNWIHLLTLSSKNQRSSFLRYLFKNEKSKENLKAKKKARKEELHIPEVIKEYSDDLLYGIRHQSLFLRIRDQSINQFDNYRALQAIRYGQSVVIDCSYEDSMVLKETVNAAKQTTYLFGDNRIHKEPFNLHLCNTNMEGEFMKQLRKNIPSIDEPWFPLNIHTKSYLEIFPRNKLVYLTPHCREELTKYDHEAVYIIGCMVDKVNSEPLSLAKAKRDGIKMAKLPLERYLEWAPGSKKNLNINHMLPILLDLKSSGDWEYSLRHIPRRKLMETKILAMKKQLMSNPHLSKEILKKFNLPKFNTPTFRERRLRSKQSLYDDDDV